MARYSKLMTKMAENGRVFYLCQIFMFLCITYENGVRMCLLRIYQLYMYTVNLKYLLTPFIKLYTALTLAYKIHFFLSTESFITNQNLFQYKSINFKNNGKLCLKIEKK